MNAESHEIDREKKAKHLKMTNDDQKVSQNVPLHENSTVFVPGNSHQVLLKVSKLVLKN